MQWLVSNKDIINIFINLFIAIGTVGAVIVALWLGLQDRRPKLNVNATVGLIMPDKTEFLMIWCVNTGKVCGPNR